MLWTSRDGLDMVLMTAEPYCTEWWWEGVHWGHLSGLVAEQAAPSTDGASTDIMHRPEKKIVQQTLNTDTVHYNRGL